MSDTDDDIFKAFIAALVKQAASLPAEVQLEFNKIGETFTIIDIQRLAELYPPLLAAYNEADVWLVTHSGQRNKGLDILPNPEFETNNSSNTDIENIYSNTSDLTDLQEILDKIDAKVQRRGFKAFLTKILQAKDSVKASRDTILVSIADGFVHE